MEILKEAQAIEKDMVLTEASKETIRKKYNADKFLKKVDIQKFQR